MRSHTRMRPALSALAAGTLVLSGPLVAPLAAQGSAVAGTPAGVESSITYTMSVPEGLRRPGHEGVKARMWGAFDFGPFISVDVNPTLSGRKSYKVKLQVKRGGKWVTCAVQRTRNVRDTFDFAVRGRKPHEFTMFHVGSCPGKVKKVSKYRIVLKAQHGYERTVSRVRLP